MFKKYIWRFEVLNDLKKLNWRTPLTSLKTEKDGMTWCRGPKLTRACVSSRRRSCITQFGVKVFRASICCLYPDPYFIYGTVVFRKVLNAKCKYQLRVPKLRKAIISLVLSVRLSNHPPVFPLGATWLLPDGFCKHSNLLKIEQK